jgi:hypothetical protein
MPGSTLVKPRASNATLALNVTLGGDLILPGGRLTLSGGGSLLRTANLLVASSATLELRTTQYDMGTTFVANRCNGTPPHPRQKC